MRAVPPSDAVASPFLRRGELYSAPYRIGDTTLSGETAGLVIRAMAGNKTLESAVGYYGRNPWEVSPPAFPSAMQAPLAVVNDGRSRTIVFVNDGDNPTDNWTKYFGSLPMTVTFNLAAWKCAPAQRACRASTDLPWLICRTASCSYTLAERASIPLLPASAAFRTGPTFSSPAPPTAPPLRSSSGRSTTTPPRAT